MSEERTAAAVQLRNAGNSTSAIARQLGVGASSVTRALARYDRQPPVIATIHTRAGADDAA